ncbi:ATP-binding cassette domain-containing protein [Clostridium chromiireducens]|uniref:ATP-binding cassette domain-containing protein n=1 Tax=Clostridium chromiireducens TaxID=225345 RepID=A0A964RKF8_9CLOT|nr:zonular occludens toxin domain-containing protein [Clostridium chromiireducens]MVX63135.1 ATP-binding cassette domain-containing protein [Clostridium chromiireducens]
MVFVYIIFLIYIVLSILQVYLTPRHGKLELIMGKAGSGKSTLIAHLVKKANKKNRPIYCNHHVLGAQKIEHTWLGRYMLENCDIIIDEAQICFDNRDFKNFTKELKFFFSNYRHFKADIYIVSQSWDDLDIKIRRQAKKIYIMQNSFIPFTILLQRIRMKFGVNEDKTDIVTKFGTSIVPLIGWSLKLNFTVWHYFDSYSKPNLPPVPYQTLWGNIKEKRKISSMIKDKINVSRVTIKNFNYNIKIKKKSN